MNSVKTIRSAAAITFLQPSANSPPLILERNQERRSQWPILSVRQALPKDLANPVTDFQKFIKKTYAPLSAFLINHFQARFAFFLPLQTLRRLSVLSAQPLLS